MRLYGLFVACCLLLSCCNVQNSNEIPTAVARIDQLAIDMTFIGEVKAAKTTNISADMWGAKIAKLVPEGKVVCEGEPIAWLETYEEKKRLERAEANLKLAQKDLEKAIKEAELQNKLNELRLKEAQANLEYKKVRMEEQKKELERAKRMVEANLAPRRKLEDAELQYRSAVLDHENARINLQKVQNQVKTDKQLKEADVKKAQIEVEKNQQEYETAKENLEKAVIKAPKSGIVVYRKIWKGGKMEKVAVGDEIWRGHPFLEVPDLDKMELLVKVDEVDISRIKEGMSAYITVDAYPDLNLSGTVRSISTLAQDTGQDLGWGQERKFTGRRKFDVFIEINGHNEKLRPGLTGKAIIHIDHLEQALIVPQEAVFGDKDRHYVFLRNNGGFSRRAVELGKCNLYHRQILSGLKEGDVVALVNPFEMQEATPSEDE